MSGFSELIKNFDKTRDHIRDFFIYGFKVRSDFSRKSSRTYDDERRRVESWLGDHIRYDNTQRGRQISLTVDSGHIAEDPLYQAYYAKSFTDNDIRLHFLLLDLLADGKTHTLRELTDRLDTDYAALFEEQTVRGKLREYTREGLVIAEKQGKTACYRLSADTVDSFWEMSAGLTDAVRFFSEVQPFGVVGNSILKSIGAQNDVFLQKHHYIVHTLEDETLSVILHAMEEKRYLTFRVFSSRSALTNASGHDARCVPLQIFISVQTGRRYLAGYVPEYRQFSAFRLDFIREVKQAETCADYDGLAEQLHRDLPKLFGVSFGIQDPAGAVEPLRVTFRIREKEEAYVLERIRREMRSGTVERIGADTFLLTLDIFDPKEALPWIRTFTGRVLSVEGGCLSVRDQFHEDVLRMQALYKESDHVDIP